MTNQAESTEQAPLWTRDFVRIAIVNFFLFLGFQILLPVLPVYAAKLGGGDTWAGLVVGVYTFSSVLMRPVAGRLLDQKGRKPIFILGLAVFIICTLMYQWALAIWMLLALRFIHGFGWGTASTAASTIASDFIPKKRFAEGMGYFGLTGTLAMALGPAIGLALMSGYGFTTVVNISVLVVLVSLLITLPVKMYNIEFKAELKPAGIIEQTAVLPALVMFFVTMSYGAIVSFIALYAEQRLVPNIGLFFTVYAIALIFARPSFGRIADRRGTSFVIIPGILAILTALLLLYLAETLSLFLMAGFIYGLGFGAVQPALQAMAVRHVIPERRGAANATFFLGFDLGIGIGSIIWGIVAEAFGYGLVYLWAMLPVLAAISLYLKKAE